MKSFWKRRSCLFAVALAAGGAGTFLELQAALADQGRTVSRSIFVQAPAPDFALVEIAENGDGTASVLVLAEIDACRFLGAARFDSTTFTISVVPGQSGRGGGTGHFTIEDAFVFDPCTGQVLFFDVSVDIAVADATDVGAFVRQGVSAQTNPMTGEIRIVREHIVGNQASGATAGSVSIFVDDGTGAPGLVVDASGGFGTVTSNTVHTVERIR